MKKFTILGIMAMIAMVAMLSTGCAKNPKINLTNLREASGSSAAPEQDFSADNFGTAENDFGKGGNTDANGWSDLNAPVAALSGADQFIKDAKPWDKKVYFDYNRYEIKASQRAILDELGDYLNKNANLAVVIEGHCDERGSDEYNRSLSERRALAVRDYLNALGIDMSRMFTLSYGEDKPEVPNASTEAEHAKNRRGQFLLGEKR